MKYALHLVISVVICVFAAPVSAETYTVTNLNDSGPGSLRYGLLFAFDEVNFAVTGTILTSSPICICQGGNIVGPGADLLIIDGNNTHSVLNNPNAATISGITIRNGRSSAGGAGIDVGANLTINNSKIIGNTSVGSGGAIYNATYSLTINNSIIRGNTSGANGGAIWSWNGPLSINNSTISGNTATNFGGAIYSEGSGSSYALTNSTVSGNSAGTGGAIYNRAGGNFTATISNSTLSQNSATAGGAVYNLTIGGGDIDLSVRNSTFSENSASNGGAICNCAVGPGSSVLTKNSLFKSGPAGANLVGLGITSGGYNLSNESGGGFLTGTGDQLNTDPLLGPLQNNGGPTFTHALLPGSPAIDAGDPNFTPPPSTDQRGFTRIVDGNSDTVARIDIGAYEVQLAPTAAAVSVSGRVLTAAGRGLNNAYVTLTRPDGSVRIVLTSAFGYYRFDDVAVGDIYLVNVSSKRYTFTPQVVSLVEEITDLNFIAEP